MVCTVCSGLTVPIGYYSSSILYLAPSVRKELRFSRDATFRTIHSASTRESALSLEHPTSALSIQGIGMTKEDTSEEKGIQIYKHDWKKKERETSKITFGFYVLHQLECKCSPTGGSYETWAST